MYHAKPKLPRVSRITPHYSSSNIVIVKILPNTKEWRVFWIKTHHSV